MLGDFSRVLYDQLILGRLFMFSLELLKRQVIRRVKLSIPCRMSLYQSLVASDSQLFYDLGFQLISEPFLIRQFWC